MINKQKVANELQPIINQGSEAVEGKYFNYKSFDTEVKFNSKFICQDTEKLISKKEKSKKFKPNKSSPFGQKLGSDKEEMHEYNLSNIQEE